MRLATHTRICFDADLGRYEIELVNSRINEVWYKPTPDHIELQDSPKGEDETTNVLLKALIEQILVRVHRSY